MIHEQIHENPLINNYEMHKTQYTYNSNVITRNVTDDSKQEKMERPPGDPTPGKGGQGIVYKQVYIYIYIYTHI